MKKIIRNLLTALLAFATVFTGVAFTSQSEKVYAATSGYAQTEARKQLDMINGFRTGEDAWYWNETNSQKVYASGLQQLEWDYELEKAAMVRAKEIAQSFSHTRPDGSSCFSVYPSGYMAKGENIAAGQRDVKEAFVDWREDSDDYSGQGHRRNMLSDKFNRVGVAAVYVEGSAYGWYYVQEFGYSSNPNNYTDPVDDIGGNGSTDNKVDDGTDKVEDEKAQLIDQAKKFKMSKTSTSVKKGKKITLKTKYASGTVKWTSSNKKIATVSSKGVVTGKKTGTVTISAYCKAFKKTVKCKVKVK